MSDHKLMGGALTGEGARMMLDGWLSGDAHFYPLLVQFEDTDAGGIVYHANYLSFAERGRSGWLRVIGISQSDYLSEHKVGFVVRRASLDYLRPAKLGDEVIVETRLKELGRARVTALQCIKAAPQYDEKGDKITNGHIFANVEVEIVMVNESGRPVRFADDMLNRMKQIETSSK